MMILPAPHPFLEFQTLADLLAIARRATPGTLARIAALIPTGATVHDLFDLIDAGGALTPRTAETLHPVLLLAATLPGDDAEAFHAATCLLLADRLRGGAGTDDLFHHWDTLRDSYRAAPAPIRSAICRGFALCQARGLVVLDEPPAPADLLTLTTGETLSHLRLLARTMTPADIAAVAHADLGRDADRHEEALRQVLTEGSGLLPEGDRRWFPGEVVERCSDDPEHSGFVDCTALLLIEAIERRDALGLAAGRWAAFAPVYIRSPRVQSSILLGGFRHLAEKMPGWSPYADWDRERIAREGVAIPLT